VAGYSETPLPAKLGVKPGRRVAVLGDGPPGFVGQLADVGATVLPRLRTPIDVVVLFATEARQLDRRLPAAKAALAYDGALWVAWPKRASNVPTDLTENVVRDLALGLGLVDTKVCAIDDVWSGLKLVYRLADRPAAG
jgi:hypothetical protein